jgi:sulfite reductase (NADPH) hemoprotein beta-component
MSQKPSPVEKIKEESRGLRGTMYDSLANEITGALYDADQNLLKFHGMYQQDDRDRREEREQKKLERLFSYMIRLRLPGGFLTANQWEALHHIAGEHSTGVIKITTRQTIQLHGILKNHIKPTIQDFNKASLDSIAACGDVNRNVTATAHPGHSPLHAEVHSYADKISTLLLPKTRAYYEIWLDEEEIDRREEIDPLYQDRYLPRKFKIGIAIPPNNDADVFTNDVGLIAIIENGQLQGYNIAIGGGLSFTHGNKDTYPRLATIIGFVAGEEKVLKTVYEILTVQRDFGNRSDRKRARLKYTVDNMTVEGFKKELESRTGFQLEPARPFEFTTRSDDWGWKQDDYGLWHYTLFVEHGRVLDTEELAMKTALLEIAKTGLVNFRFTCNQHLIVADVKGENKEQINALLQQYGLIEHTEKATGIRKASMACVAFPTCPLALAEAQRYLPTLITKIEAIQEKHGLQGDQTIIRMTGCPNGCGRSTASEIGFIGTAYGQYNLMLGGDRLGYRLNKLYRENLDEAAILSELDGLFGAYKSERIDGEPFGDFSLRKQWV